MIETKLYTVGEIAETLHEPPNRIAYIISKHRIHHVERVGIIRRFSLGQVEDIRRGLYGLQIRGQA